MGSGASVDAPEVETQNITAVEEEEHSPDMPTPKKNEEKEDDLGPMPNIGQKKHGLVRRPSEMVRTVLMLESEQEKELEEKILKKNPDMRRVFTGFEECNHFLADEKNRADPADDYFAKLNKLLADKIISMFNKYSKDEERSVMANKLANIGFVNNLFKYYIFVTEELGLLGVTEGFIQELWESDPQRPGDVLILKAREIWWNFSDSSTRFAEKIAETEVTLDTRNADGKPDTNTIFKILLNDLKSQLEDGLEEVEAEEEKFAFSSAVGILHNCARNPIIDKEKFRSIGLVDVLIEFLKSKDVYIKTITLLALGNMIKEDEVDRMHAGIDVLDFLIDAIKNSLDAKERKKYGFHLSELVDGVAALARSDKNKIQIMEKDPMSFIKKMMPSTHSPEVKAAIKLAWELAFLQENKEKINADKEFMKMLKSRTNDSDTDVRNAADGAIFVIEGMSKRTTHLQEDQKQPKASADVHKAPLMSVAAAKHVMFSYSWGDKEMVYKIYNRLRKQGYNIWIDIEEMGKYANLLEGMSRAVEDAHTILVCFSEKYKNSQNCRTEADYAFTLRKNIIPLKMQRGYTPDGWLGIFIGARLFIEFSDKYPFEQKFRELTDQIPSAVDVPSTPTAVVPVPSQSQPASGTPVVVGTKRVAEWQKNDVEKWATDNKMSGNSFKPVRMLSGRNLHFLAKVSSKAPDTFYRWCEDKLKLRTLDDLMLFSEAVETLNILS